MLAAAKCSTSIGELRAALDGHFEREWPQVRARMDAVEGSLMDRQQSRDKTAYRLAKLGPYAGGLGAAGTKWQTTCT